MMDEVKHTATPWRVFNKHRVLSIMKANSNREVIHWAGFDSSAFQTANQANAAFIVTAVNIIGAHEDKLERLMKFNPGVSEVDLIGRLLVEEINKVKP
jgi:hypothetical protein